MLLIFLVAALSCLEIGYGLWAYSTISRAAKLGARYGELHISDGAAQYGRAVLTREIEHIVRDNVDGLGAEEMDIVTTWPPQSARGLAVQVQVTYPFRPLTGSLIRAGERVDGIFPQFEMAVTN